jgi:hypothetical protein
MSYSSSIWNGTPEDWFALHLRMLRAERGWRIGDVVDLMNQLGWDWNRHHVMRAEAGTFGSQPLSKAASLSYIYQQSLAGMMASDDRPFPGFEELGRPPVRFAPRAALDGYRFLADVILAPQYAADPNPQLQAVRKWEELGGAIDTTRQPFTEKGERNGKH